MFVRIDRTHRSIKNKKKGRRVIWVHYTFERIEPRAASIRVKANRVEFERREPREDWLRAQLVDRALGGSRAALVSFLLILVSTFVVEGPSL